MGSSLSIIWIMLFIVLIVGAFLSSLYSKKYFYFLRSHYTAEWEKIKDDGIFAGEIKTQANLLKFTLTKSYENIGDHEFSKLGNKLRLLLLIYIPVFVIFFFLTVFIVLNK